MIAVLAFSGLLAGFLGYFAVKRALSVGVRVRKRFGFQMKPGCGPTIEGVLLYRTAREFVLANAELVEDADRSHSLGGRVRVLRENVAFVQEIA